MNESVEAKDRRRQQLINEFEAARREVFRSIEDLNPREMKQPIIDGWSIKDILVHILEWDLRSLQDAKELLSDHDIDKHHWINPDEFNREATEKYRDIPVPQIIDDLAQVTQRVVEFLTSVPQENLFRERAFEYEGEKLSVVWVLSYPEHDREHAQQILAWRRQRGI